MRGLAVAIDGPAGAGKSTVSRRVAAELGYLLLDTGALYRGVALAAVEAGLADAEPARVEALAAALAASGGLRFEAGEGGAPRLLLGGRDVSAEIRTQAVAEVASRVSALPGVRSALLDLQRDAGRAGGVVLEGRDIGTVVLPDAEVKVYLTASVEVRARRRHDELGGRADAPSLAQIAREVEERDRRDTTRPIAPLRKADDAVVVDSSDLHVDEVVALIVGLVRERQGAPARPPG